MVFRSGRDWKIEYPFEGSEQYRLYIWNEGRFYWSFRRFMTEQEAWSY